MNVSQESLDGWPRACERLRGVMLEIRNCLLSGRTEPALELVEFAYVAVLILGNEMRMAGAARAAPPSPPAQVSMPVLGSAANRRYATALREAYEAGAEVDRERGWGDDGPAQILKMILTDVETQVFDRQDAVTKRTGRTARRGGRYKAG